MLDIDNLMDYQLIIDDADEQAIHTRASGELFANMVVPRNIVHDDNGTVLGSGQANNFDGTVNQREPFQEIDTTEPNNEELNATASSVGDIDPREIVTVEMNCSGGNGPAERDLNEQIDGIAPMPDASMKVGSNSENLGVNHETEPLVAPLVEPLIAPVAENRVQCVVNDVFSGDSPFVLEVNS